MTLILASIEFIIVNFIFLKYLLIYLFGCFGS